MASIVAVPSLVQSLRSTQTSVGKRGSMLPTLFAMKGKLSVCLETRKARRTARGEHAELSLMQPLIHIQGGLTQTGQKEGAEGEEQEEASDEDNDMGIDDELGDEDDEEERLYKDAFENEGIDDEEDGMENGLNGLDLDDDEL